ncbi:MAG: hypothetical protein ABL984_01800 [Pyrinomonadaceae bacterium]
MREIRLCLTVRQRSEKGSALVIALFVLVLVGGFAALAISRTAAEATAVGNEAAEARTFYAAQGSLEYMTRSFNKVFEIKLSPTTADIDKVRDGSRVPTLATAQGGQFTFSNEVLQTKIPTAVTLQDDTYGGLYALRDHWRLRTTTTDTTTRTQVQLTRNILNDRIPIFQFGVFYDDDLELFRPPLFAFGGRVHSNRHFFVSPGSEGVYFDSKVTAAGHIVTQSWRNGYTGDSANTETYIKNASGVFKKLQPTFGSVLNGTPNVFAGDLDMPSSKINSSFGTQTAIFDGNLKAQTPVLKLPLKVGTDIDLVEMIRRGKEAPGANAGDYFAGAADDGIMRSERYANKTGIRVSLADSKLKLPGCAATATSAVTAACGVRLDGSISGDGSGPVPVPSPMPSPLVPATVGTWSRGYQPRPMKSAAGDTTFNYVPTRVNGERLHTGGTREVWIKIETVQTNDTTGAIETKDITEDFLSLGITEEAPSTMTIAGYSGSRAAANNGTFDTPSANLTATAAQTATTYPDSRSIVKLQRFMMPGSSIPGTTYVRHSATYGGTYVRRFSTVDAADMTQFCLPTLATCTDQASEPSYGVEGAKSSAERREHFGHLKFLSSDSYAIVPFPIEMFDTREGEFYDDMARYTANKVTRNGVMSIIDIDVANLRRFLRGDFNGLFPTTTPFATANGGLENSDIPQKEGWVLYVSDRRGDADFDGEYDMEDVYGDAPGNDGTLQKGEDINKSGALDAKYIESTSNSCVGFATTCEATKFSEEWSPDYAATTDHKYYRRGVRLINGTTLPGIYDATTPANTRGFTVSSENGVYVLGNYNATHVTSIPAAGNTPYIDYRPFDTTTHVPASIAADAVMILSNAWNDSKSFKDPYEEANRTATDTTIRFAMIAGDTLASKEATPNQGGISPRLNGGVHNFKRFLEQWTGDSLNYSGSLINLFNSRNNNGSFKCCETVYDPPKRNWVFDGTFLDPTRLPPGSPYFQYVQTTGFERTNN